MIYVYVPDGAEAEDRFPVLYMLDGHNVFFDSEATYGKSWGMKDYLDRERLPLIVVGIDCNHRPNNGRLSEYSPFTFEEEGIGKVYGKGRLFMDWLCGTLKPIIDARYPTLPGRETTWMAGSSMGGLMTLYAVSAYNEVFSRGAALSPSVWTQPKPMLKLLRRAAFDPDTVLYMDYGRGEFRNHAGMEPLFNRTASLLMERGVNVTARIVPGGEHCEACWEQQVPFFMQVLMYPGFE